MWCLFLKFRLGCTLVITVLSVCVQNDFASNTSLIFRIVNFGMGGGLLFQIINFGMGGELGLYIPRLYNIVVKHF